MIGYLQGKVTYIASDFCFIDVHGVGYRVFISTSTRAKLKLNEEIKLFTYLSVREDAMLLYGFINQLEYDVFCKLISVSKIGPKAGLGLLSSLSSEKLIWAIQNKQVSLLTNAPGIGKKTAERIVLELKDKLTELNLSISDEVLDQPILIDTPSEDEKIDMYEEATQALLSLGYTKPEINSVLKKAGNITNTEDIIKFALKELSLS